MLRLCENIVIFCIFKKSISKISDIASLLSRQEKERDDYQKNINHVYQIIFIDDIDKANLKLYDRYESRNEEGKLEKYNLLTRVYVQMPYINLIKKQKKLEEFSEIEKGIYIFENGITDDIISYKLKQISR